MSQLPQRLWSEEDWERIRRGYAARDMDEKWNVFCEGGTVFLHRSWTGYGVYEATFTPTGDGGRRITAALVERDAEIYRCTDDAYDCVMLELVLSAIVLGEPAAGLRARLVELTRRGPGADDAHAGLVLHSVLGRRSDT
ncbi:hypothetical protein [Streptomyces indicus]|uniref:hypothetical protein n=1 Tax=Streptomyces indicus TaxID=417292 RepID=UPI000B834551|nr:hypothetical protein [Streptomyces indicus]